ncbi:VCBS repeat-containing protein, partial [Shewanella algae]
LQNNGKGAFNPIVFDLGGIGCSHQIASASADFNGDGNQDIVVLCTNGTNASSVALLLADGTGNFLIRSVGNMNFAAQSFAVGNFTS